jgi:hypothetical protein
MALTKRESATLCFPPPHSLLPSSTSRARHDEYAAPSTFRRPRCLDRRYPGGNQREEARKKNEKKLAALAKGNKKESASSLQARKEACVLVLSSISPQELILWSLSQRRRGAPRETEGAPSRPSPATSLSVSVESRGGQGSGSCGRRRQITPMYPSCRHWRFSGRTRALSFTLSCMYPRRRASILSLFPLVHDRRQSQR